MQTRQIMLVSLIVAGAVLWLNTAKGQLEGRVTLDPDTQAAQFLQSEQKLREVYTELAQVLEPIGQKKLALSQEAWTRYKAAECDFESSYSAVEPLHPQTYNECLTVMNLERASNLNMEIQWQTLLESSQRSTN